MSLKHLLHICITLPCAALLIVALICFVIPYSYNEITSEESFDFLSLIEDFVSEYLPFLLLIPFTPFISRVLNCWIRGQYIGEYYVVTGHMGWTQHELKNHLEAFYHDGINVIDEVSFGNCKSFKINFSKDRAPDLGRLWKAVEDSRNQQKPYSFTCVNVVGDDRVMPLITSQVKTAAAVINAQPTAGGKGSAQQINSVYPSTQPIAPGYPGAQPKESGLMPMPIMLQPGPPKTPQVTSPVAQPDAVAAWKKQDAEVIRIAPPTRDRQLLKDPQPVLVTDQHQSRANNRYTQNAYNPPPIITNQNQYKPTYPAVGGGLGQNSGNNGAKALFSGFMAKKGGPTFTVEIAQGNLIHERVGAIVNPANVHLSHGGGAAKAIADAAGRELLKDCDEVLRNRPRNTLQLGDAVSTTAGKLRPGIQFVIHACGPKHDSYKDVSRIYQVLRDSFYRSMECANSLPVGSISIPAIGSGIYGLDKTRTAHEAFTAVEAFVKFVNPPIQLRLIRFVNVDAETTDIFLDVFRKRYQNCSIAVQGARSRSRSADSGPMQQNNNISGTKNKSSSQGRNLNINGLEFAKVKPANSDYDNFKPTPRQIKNRQNGGVKRVDNNAGRASNEDEESEGSSETKKLLGQNSYTQYESASSKRARSQSRDKKANQQLPTSYQEESEVSGSKKSLVQSFTQYEAASSRKARSQSRERKMTQSLQVAGQKRESSSSAEDCPICLNGITSAKKLKCGHVFCTGCIDEAFKTCGPKCPTCGAMHGIRKGNQPEGTMTINVDHNTRLPGYEQYGSIVILYIMPDGIQGPEHPNPGYPFQGTTRKAFLPDSLKGQKVCDLLKKAFDQRLIFTVGRSATTGRDNVVTWNDVHHKTAIRGQFGYPDDTYLTRVKDELAAKGITDEDGGSRGRESSF